MWPFSVLSCQLSRSNARDNRLAAPLLNEPFNHGEIGVLMQKWQEALLQIVNNVIRQMKSDGTLRKLHEKFGLVYAYE